MRNGDTLGFSILVPVFNGSEFIEEAILSALNQMNEADELLIQDGGSTDGTQDIVARLAQKDSRIKWVSERDSGQSNALNRALERATNGIIAWLNADDWYLDGALDWARAVFSQNPELEFAYGGCTLFRNDREVRRHEPAALSVDKLVRSGCYIYTGSSFFSKAALARVGGFPEDLHYAMDYELFLRLAEAQTNYTYTTEQVGAFRWHPLSKSGSEASEFVREVRNIRTRHTTPSLLNRLRVEAATLRHVLVEATTPIRHSSAYSRLRGQRRF